MQSGGPWQPQAGVAESALRLSGVLAQGLFEKWGGNEALPAWQALEVTMACFRGQISAFGAQN